MEHHINVKILDAIKDSDLEKPVKDFLVSALFVEHDNVDKDKPRLKEDYDKLIRKGAAAMRGE